MRYVGITSRDPHIRKQEWENTGRIVSGFKVIHTGLYYDDAQRLENQYKEQGYNADIGGPRVSGPVYSVYIFEY